MRAELYPVDPASGMPLVSELEHVQDRYVEMRLKGESHNIAETLALQSPPHSVSDREFNMGRCNNNQFANFPALGNYYKKVADQQNASITGRYYVQGLGAYPGDPKAWVSGRGEALARAKELGVNLSGLVDYQAPDDQKPLEEVGLASNIWEREAADLMEQNPEMRYADAKERAYNLRASIYAKPPTEEQIITPGT